MIKKEIHKSHNTHVITFAIRISTWEKETSKHRPFAVRPICSSLNPNAKPKAANKPSSPSLRSNVTTPYI